MPMPPHGGARALTQEQKDLIQTTLSEFDPENLTEADALSIVETFRSAGIQPGPQLAEVMAESGFDAKAVGDLAGVAPPPPPPPQQGGGNGLNIDDKTLQQLSDLLDRYYSGDLSDAERENTLASIQDLLQQSAPAAGVLDVMA
jgi:hypothetical protein